MQEHRNFYIDGAWVPALGTRTQDVIDPSTEQPVARIALGDARDLDHAVVAARRAFPAWAAQGREQRLAVLHAVIAAYESRMDEIAMAISLEMGAPITLARQAHAVAGLSHLKQAARVLAGYAFDEVVNRTRVAREPIGVCGLITPWNWPMNQIACKVAPALAAGCTVVLKPSETAPLSALLFAQVLHAAGVPPGVFNLVNGDGPGVGAAMAAHADIDMVSFTGSTRAGVAVAKAAADTVKRVAQELGGKSPHIVVDGVDLPATIRQAALQCFRNSGQSCNAPTRLLVPAHLHDAATAIAVDVAQSLRMGDPRDAATTLGPVANAVHYGKVRECIATGLHEGAQLATGGLERPPGLEQGYFVQPTVFANVRNTLAIAREEIFGPVLCILPYGSEEEAIAIANDTVYGLSACVSAPDLDHARRIARRLRAGMVHINGARADHAAPFGGYRQSGNGREWGRLGFEEYLETKSMFGYEEPEA
ncbi:NAD-dependent aldehyde dehydrogenase [Acidovorax sp. CF316]|uniref:aldehyde dehydrogenase family protein n=1 Tax=Acidovorax sp. CF316 TaxID=1144317 RepID=UPI00026BEA6B|nr:aldehyde dehydrogenase family protein [Acidovorax sp. CF316]EJE49851.1 NAD-dependent aldehyde dehydrogenase [Acidovorax sp. CF316]